MVIIDVNVDDATFYVDGRIHAGPASSTVLPLSDGKKHRLRVEAPGRKRHEQTVFVKPGASITVNVKLARASGGSGGSSSGSATTTPKSGGGMDSLINPLQKR